MRLLTELQNLDNIPDGDTRKIINYTAGSGIDISDGIISATGGGSGGTYDYDELANHPKINGVELVGDKSNEDLGINIPTKISQLEDDGYLITIKTGERRWGTYARE